MTFWAVTIAVLFITVIPLILGIKAYKSEKMRYGYIGVVISIAGIALSLHLANIWQILPDYGVAKFFFVILLAVLGNGAPMLYAYCEECGDLEDPLIIFGIPFLICAFGLFVAAPIEHNIAYNNKIETTTYTEIAPETIELISLNSGMGVEGSMSVSGNMFAVVGSGYVNSEPVYFYYHRNENGAIIRSYVPSASNISQIFDVLGTNEQAYLQIINTIEMTTNNNVSPAEITKRVIKTQYNFYVPTNTVPVEFELNLN